MVQSRRSPGAINLSAMGLARPEGARAEGGTVASTTSGHDDPLQRLQATLSRCDSYLSTLESTGAGRAIDLETSFSCPLSPTTRAAVSPLAAERGQSGPLHAASVPAAEWHDYSATPRRPSSQHAPAMGRRSSSISPSPRGSLNLQALPSVHSSGLPSVYSSGMPAPAPPGYPSHAGLPFSRLLLWAPVLSACILTLLLGFLGGLLLLPPDGVGGPAPTTAVRPGAGPLLAQHALLARSLRALDASGAQGALVLPRGPPAAAAAPNNSARQQPAWAAAGAQLEATDRAWGAEVIAAALASGHLQGLGRGGAHGPRPPPDEDYDDDRDIDYDESGSHDYLLEEEDLAERAAAAAHARPGALAHTARTKRPIKDSKGRLTELVPKLKVCLMTADFWGLPTAGGTATAYGLLAGALEDDPNLEVVLLGVSKMIDKCIKGRKMQGRLHPRVTYACFEERHFQPFVVTTQPYEQLSHATLAWLKENQGQCDVLQVHEWGGVFPDIVTYSHFRQFRPGLRISINPHGGHYWSTQGQLPRPTDIMSLRIDNGERSTLELADIVLSPTRYIASWLRQRGWKLPENRLPVPNMIADLDKAPTERTRKPVWRVAFFGRLEERKGIKLFVDSVQRLPKEVLERENFEAYFVGAESKIDQQLSSTWLKKNTKDWTWKTFIMANTPRDKALATISAPGILLVLASMIDNMPYVLAEASVMRIPLLIYDVGGVTEMIDPKLHADIICGTPKGDELAPRMRDALLAGELGISALSPRVTTGKEQWQEWHHDFALNQMAGAVADDLALRAAAASMDHGLEVVDLDPDETALQLFERVCDAAKCSDIGCAAPVPGGRAWALSVLLLPREFSLINISALPELVELLNIAELRGGVVGALTFGAELPPYMGRLGDGCPAGAVCGLRHGFPTAPTWQIYEGEVEPWLMSDMCTESVPVLLRRATFCSAFAADARDFRRYNSWVLSLLLQQARLTLHTYPSVPFRLDNWTTKGYHCVLDKTPDRILDIQTAANLMTDDLLMRSAQLTPNYRPLVDFHADYSDRQGAKGWRYGFTDAAERIENTTLFYPFVFVPDRQSGQLPDGKWQPSLQMEYPQFYRYILHPCVSWPDQPNMCGGRHATTAVLRFDSFLSADDVVIMLIYEVFPKCGDGVDFEVTLSPAAGGPTQMLHAAEYEVSAKPTRQRLHFYMDRIATGDKVDFAVYPRMQHDCDGALLLEAQLWEQSAYKG